MRKIIVFFSCFLFIGLGSVRSQTVTSKNLDLRAYRIRQIQDIKEKTHSDEGNNSGVKNESESPALGFECL